MSTGEHTFDNHAESEDGPSETADWRDLDAKLNELPDDELLKALKHAGVKSVLPSHKKGHSESKVPGRRGDATQRWTQGDWVERVEMGALKDAEKFMTDPAKPPTGTSASAPEAIATALAQPAARTLGGIVWGALAGVVLIGGGLWLWQSQTDARPLQVPAREVTAEAPAPAPVVAATDSAPALPTKAAEAPRPAAVEDVQLPPPEYSISRKRFARMLRAAKKGNARAMSVVAQAYIERDKPEAALRWARKAYKADRKNIDHRVVLGDAYQLAGDDMRAERIWRRALKRAPRHKALRQRLGKPAR